VEALFEGTGCGGNSVWAGVGAGRDGGFGMYSGPVWPQPLSRQLSKPSSIAEAERSAGEDFTIRIMV
jgi:hypothetical protein